MNFFRTFGYYFLYPFIRIAIFFAHPVFHVTGKKNLPKGAYILCCNHANISDPFWVIVACKPKKVFRFMAKIEFSRKPVLGKLMALYGVIFVDRGHRDYAAMDRMREAMRNGDATMIFPEGTRVKYGTTAPAKVGAIQLAQECRVPIVPMYLTQNKKFFHPLKAVIGKPYDPIPDFEPRTRDEMKVLAEELRVKIYALGEEA